jgi:hypothetical protein
MYRYTHTHMLLPDIYIYIYIYVCVYIVSVLDDLVGSARIPPEALAGILDPAYDGSASSLSFILKRGGKKICLISPQWFASVCMSTSIAERERVVETLVLQREEGSTTNPTPSYVTYVTHAHVCSHMLTYGDVCSPNSEAFELTNKHGKVVIGANKQKALVQACLSPPIHTHTLTLIHTHTHTHIHIYIYIYYINTYIHTYIIT